MIPTLARAALILLGSWILGRILLLWSARPDANPTHVKWVGLVGILLTLIATLNYFNYSAIDLYLSAGRDWELLRPAALAVVGAIGGFILVACVRTIHHGFRISRLPSLLVTPWLLHLYASIDVIDEETKSIITRSRDQLEMELRETSRNPDLVFRWVERCQLPFTTGFRRPLVCCPIWVTQVEDGEFMNVLLKHEAIHVLKRHHQLAAVLGLLGSLMPWLGGMIKAIRDSTELEVDHAVVQGSLDHGAEYRRALTTVVQQAQDPAVAGIGHDPRNVERRLGQMGRLPGGFGWQGVAALTAGCAMVLGSIAMGRPRLGDLLTIALRQQGSNLQVLIGDPKLHVYRMPSTQSSLGEGIGADATRVNAPFVVVEHVRKLPLEINGEAWIQLHYRAKGSGPRLPVVLVNLAGDPVHTPIPGSTAIAQRVRTLDADVAQLQSGKGVLRLHLQGEPGSSVELSGPSLCLPKGWSVELTSMEILPAERFDARSLQVRRDSALTTWRSFTGTSGMISTSPLNLAWTQDRGLVGY